MEVSNCLNPYYSGTYTLTTFEFNINRCIFIVLILIILELTL